MDTNLRRKQKPLGQGISKQHSEKAELHQFKQYVPKPLPYGIGERIAEYAAMPSYWERVK